LTLFLFPSPLRGEGKGGGEKDIKKKLRDISRTLRKRSTDVENYLWRYLRNRQIEGFKFRRQQPIGKYIVDFVNFKRKIVIEVDGGQHTIYKEKDKVRDNWLKKEGYRVVRLWDNEVLNNIEGVLEVIREKLLTPHPNPLPQGEREKRNF